MIDKRSTRAYKLEKENKKLKELCNKYEEEHKTAFKLWTMKMEEIPTYEEKIEMQKEIERLNNDIKILLKENENKEKVILKYNNIINELEKAIKEEYDYCEKRIDPAFGTGMGVATRILNRLKELKGSDK